MKNYKLAWRNLWRNRRRTIITVMSVFFAVFFALFMRSIQLGTYGIMFKNVIESYSGYAQVQNEKFWEDMIVDNVFEVSDDLNSIITKDDNVLDIIPRFESFALASSGSRSKGVMVMGIDPEKEKLLSDIEAKLVKYRLSDEALKGLFNENLSENLIENLELFRGNSYSSDGKIQLDLAIEDEDAGIIMPLLKEHAGVENGYFNAGEDGALVGDRLAKYLGLTRGDTIVLLGQGYHGNTAAGKFVINGIVKIPSPEIDNKIVYLPVSVCQNLYYAENKLSSMVLHLDKNDDDSVDETLNRLNESLDSPYRLIGWRKMNEAIVQQMEADDKGGQIMIGILYLVIAFGVFGTVLMMTAERQREFGVLIAIGMQKTKMAAVMVYEMIYIGFLGIAAGIAVALPAIIYGYNHPIRFSSNVAKMFEDFGFEPVMAFQWIDSYFISQSIIVAVIVLLALLYPVTKIWKLKEINALKA